MIVTLLVWGLPSLWLPLPAFRSGNARRLREAGRLWFGVLFIVTNRVDNPAALK